MRGEFHSVLLGLDLGRGVASEYRFVAEGNRTRAASERA